MRALLRFTPVLIAAAAAVVPLAPDSAATASTRAPALASNQGVVDAQAGLTVRGSQVGDYASSNLPAIGYLAYDQVVTIRCYYTGQTITGPYGPTDVWDSIVGYQGGQYDGIASDAWIYTGSNTPRVPPCSGP